jgi:hypothetical protein
MSTASCPEAACRLEAGETVGIAGGLALLVVRAPAAHGALCIDTVVLTLRAAPSCGARSTGPGAIRAGDRFHDGVTGLEVVCTEPGDGVLTFAGRMLMKSRSRVRRAPNRG